MLQAFQPPVPDETRASGRGEANATSESNLQELVKINKQRSHCSVWEGSPAAGRGVPPAGSRWQQCLPWLLPRAPGTSLTALEVPSRCECHLPPSPLCLSCMKSTHSPSCPGKSKSFGHLFPLFPSHCGSHPGSSRQINIQGFKGSWSKTALKWRGKSF